MAKYDAGVLVVDDELFYREAIRDALAPGVAAEVVGAVSAGVEL